MGRGYSGNHPRFSHRQDERYDAKEAYNKDLTASARLHYLENDRHDHDSPANSHCSPMHRHNDRHIRREARQIARKNEGDEQDIYYELKAQIDDERSQPRGNMTRHIRPKPKVKVNDERSGEIRNQMIDEMLDDRPDSPMNRIVIRGKREGRQMDKSREAEAEGNLRKAARHANRAARIRGRQKAKFIRKEASPAVKEGLNALSAEKFINDKSPMNACAKSEGGKGCVQQMGGAWRVISNKTDKPWPAKYANKAKAEAALRGYHAG